MRMTQDDKDKARATIVNAAGVLFREEGLAATGVDAVARKVRQTSGAFYAHFASKAEVFHGAVAEGFVRLLNGIARSTRTDDRRWAGRFAAGYLSRAHCDAVGTGCLLPTLTLDVARASKDVASSTKLSSQRRLSNSHPVAARPATMRTSGRWRSSRFAPAAPCWRAPCLISRRRTRSCKHAEVRRRGLSQADKAKRAGSLPPRNSKPVRAYAAIALSVQPVKHRIAGLKIFLAQPRHQFLHRDDVRDAADALAAAPDVLPSLRLGAPPAPLVAKLIAACRRSAGRRDRGRRS